MDSAVSHVKVLMFGSSWMLWSINKLVFDNAKKIIKR